MTLQEANSEALSKSEQGKDGMTVVRLGFVYSIFDRLFANHNVQLKKAQEEIEMLKIQLEEKAIRFCHECGHSKECSMEKAWDTLSFEHGECDDGHFFNPFGCNKSKPRQ